MPVHDWTRDDVGIFQDFHTRWIVYLASALNRGVLPNGYLADCEQVVRPPDVADQAWIVPDRDASNLSVSHEESGIALADRLPAARRLLMSVVRPPRRHIAVRHNSGRDVVAHIEIVSLADKDRAGRFDDFIRRVVGSLERGVNVVVIDLFPPRRRDPDGIHDVIQREVCSMPYDLPDATPLTVASYIAGPSDLAFVEHLAVGDELPTIPLFLSPTRYVDLSVAPSYQRAWDDTPADWQDLVAG